MAWWVCCCGHELFACHRNQLLDPSFLGKDGGEGVPQAQHLGGLHIVVSRVHSSHVPLCLVKNANRSCKSEGCWSKSLKQLLLDWNRF
jgi:hypothetical protein